MDDIEKAQEREMLDRELLLRETRQAQRLSPKGECYACGEEVESPRIFCNRECADHHELLKRRGH